MRRRDASAGFTLLEIMIAVAILAATTVVLLRIVTNNIRATNHAKLTTAATFLARTKISDVEDDVLYNGFSTETETDKGTFKDEGPGYERFRWESMIERIELPTDMTTKAQDTATKSSQEAKSPMELMSGFLGGMMSAFIEPIRIGLQESVRKVTVRVIWDEHGRPDQTIEVVEYLTDPSQLEKTMGMAAAAAAGQVPGAQNQQNQQGNKQGQVGQAAGAVGGNRAPFPIPGGLPR
jgi:general secretion pathway protein I